MVREFRNSFSITGCGFYNNAGNLARVPPGPYSADGMITVLENGGVHIAPEAHCDDVVAFVLGCIHDHSGIDPSIKEHLKRFVDAMDAHAVVSHGYKDNPNEALWKWIPVSDNTP